MTDGVSHRQALNVHLFKPQEYVFIKVLQLVQGEEAISIFIKDSEPILNTKEEEEEEERENRN